MNKQKEYMSWYHGKKYMYTCFLKFSSQDEVEKGREGMALEREKENERMRE